MSPKSTSPRASFLLFALFTRLNAQVSITLDGVPTSGCVGSPQGTATFASSTTIPTTALGDVYIEDGGLWSQGGATWQWIIDTPGWYWANANISNYNAPGEDYPPALGKAFVLSPDKSTASFSVGPSLGTGYEINLVPVPTSMPSSATTPSSSSSSSHQPPSLATGGGIGVGASILRREPSLPQITADPIGNSAKFRGHRRQAGGSDFSLKMNAQTPCGGPPVSSSAVSKNADLASSCSANAITTNAAAYSTYGVSTYMSSLISAHIPGPTQTGRANGIQALWSDANPPGAACTFTAQCQAPSCSQIKDTDVSDFLVIQRFLAVNAVVNFNNYVFGIYDAIYKAAEITGLMSADIVSTFYTDPTPPVTWQTIMGVLAPFMGLMSAMLAPIGPEVSAVVGVANAMFGVAAGAASTMSSLTAATEPGFSEYANLDAFIAKYLESSVQGLTNLWTGAIGPETSLYGWTGSTLAPQGQQTGLFGDGSFSSSIDTSTMTSNTQTNMARIMSYKAINFALTDSGNFIQYIPYNTPVMGADGNMIQAGINQAWCESSQVSDANKGQTLICDAPGPGMAKIYNTNGQNNAANIASTTPQGWNSKLQIVPGETFSMHDALVGSVSSWQAGGFNYTISTPYEGAVNTGGSSFSASDLQAIAKLPIGQDQPGYFNIPVCNTLDLRSFPPVAGQGCLLSCGAPAANGGPKAKGQSFWTNVDDQVTTIMNSYPNSNGGCAEGPSGDYCPSAPCDFTPYVG